VSPREQLRLIQGLNIAPQTALADGNPSMKYAVERGVAAPSARTITNNLEQSD
jgi:hypothetical protein